MLFPKLGMSKSWTDTSSKFKTGSAIFELFYPLETGTGERMISLTLGKLSSTETSIVRLVASSSWWFHLTYNHTGDSEDILRSKLSKGLIT